MLRKCSSKNNLKFINKNNNQSHNKKMNKFKIFLRIFKIIIVQIMIINYNSNNNNKSRKNLDKKVKRVKMLVVKVVAKEEVILNHRIHQNPLLLPEKTLMEKRGKNKKKIVKNLFPLEA